MAHSATEHAHGHDHHEHHDTFLTKYVFSQDHKMIAKQFGITHTQLNRIRSGENWGYVTID
jgi:hypothetical protein